MSGLRCWCAFAQKVLDRQGRELPPDPDGLLAWSRLFRCHRTFQNYVNHVRIGCALLKVSGEATNHWAVKRASESIHKRGGFQSREPLFIRCDMLADLMRCATASGHVSVAYLFLASYIFLLRMPSEALPMRRGGNGMHDDMRQVQSIIHRQGDQVVLRLKTRKHKPEGSTLYRSCWCATHANLCPIHVLWHWFER